jgi:hypothetical protein
LSVVGVAINLLFKNLTSHNKCHTGRGAAKIRYPETFFLLDSGYPPLADSGMTGLMLPSKMQRTTDYGQLTSPTIYLSLFSVRRLMLAIPYELLTRPV